MKEEIDQEKLFSISKDFWQNEVISIAKYFEEQVGCDLPNEIADQVNRLSQRVASMPEEHVEELEPSEKKRAAAS